MIFDSVFNSFRGIIAYYRVRNGTLRKGDKITFLNTGRSYGAEEIGILKMDRDCVGLESFSKHVLNVPLAIIALWGHAEYGYLNMPYLQND